MNVVASAYGKDSSTTRFIENSELLYLDPNKNRTKKWMQGLGLQLPSDTTTFGSIGTITYQDGTVKIEGVPYGQYMQDEGKSNGKLRPGSPGQLCRRHAAGGVGQNSGAALIAHGWSGTDLAKSSGRAYNEGKGKILAPKFE